jgi:hypothetical protein
MYTDKSDVESLPNLLRNAVIAVIPFLQGKGIGPALPTRSYDVRWMARQNDGRSLGKFEQRTEPTFQLPSKIITALWEMPELSALLTVGARFVKEKGKFIEALHWQDPEDTAKIILADYFLRVGSIRRDDEAIQATCKAFLHDVDSETAVVETVFVVSNFRAEEAFQLTPEITFRPVTPKDIDRHSRMSEAPEWFFQKRMINDQDWICEIMHVGTKENAEELNKHIILQQRLPVALTIAVPGNATFQLLANRLPSPYLHAGISFGGPLVATSRNYGSIDLNKQGIKDFQWAYEKVTRIEEQEQYTFLRLPLRRLRLAATRQETEDQLVDYVIGLERLLASDTEQLETTFRFRLRGAALLPERFGNTTERIKLMNRLYALRSDVVHGNATQQEITEHLPIAEDILRVILRWYLTIIETLDDPRKILKKLDESLVEGGSTWTGTTAVRGE